MGAAGFTPGGFPVSWRPILAANLDGDRGGRARSRIFAEYRGCALAKAGTDALCVGPPRSPRAAAAPGRGFQPPEEARFGRIAQLVEQLTLNQRVQGSSPCAPTNVFNGLAGEQNASRLPCDMSHATFVAWGRTVSDAPRSDVAPDPLQSLSSSVADKRRHLPYLTREKLGARSLIC